MSSASDGAAATPAGLVLGSACGGGTLGTEAEEEEDEEAEEEEDEEAEEESTDSGREAKEGAR